MPETSSPTDILKLFREDLDAGARVEAFRQAEQQIRGEVEALATPENIALINENYDVTFIFNFHGDGIHAGQSLREIQSPFITFVENAGDADIAENMLFSISVQNAFDIEYNGAQPVAPQAAPTRENAWAYWRDRGLLAKGSIVMPVDIRHYSRRLLDALIGHDYDQQYLNSSITLQELREKSFDDLLADQKNKGQLITYSNAVRELTSTKQIIQTLLTCLDPKAEGALVDPMAAEKLIALSNKRRGENGKLSADIVYGSGHHSMMHVFRKLGISAERVFPGSVDMPDGLKFAGNIKDQFFSAHPFGLEDDQVEKYARQHIIESILWAPLANPVEYGVVPADNTKIPLLWARYARIARSSDLVARAEELHEEFKNDPTLPLRVLADHGMVLKPISE